MPKERIYTCDGYLEVSWYGGGGGLVCVEAFDRHTGLQVHQFTDRGSVGSLAKVLRRAKRQNFPDED